MKNYGVIALTVASPAQSFSEPMTLTQAAKFLNLPDRTPLDYDEDALIGAMITSAREIAEIEYGRDLIQKQYDLYLDGFHNDGCFYTPWGDSYGLDGGCIELPQPLTSVDLVRYRDSDGNYTTLVEDTDYIVDLARALVMPTYSNSWPSFTPWPSSAVLLRFTCGYTATHPFWSNDGQRLLMGMRSLISAWFTGRLPFEATPVISEYPFGVTSLFRYGARRLVR